MNHYTPAELATNLKEDEEDIIEECLRLGVPIVHGRIDRKLYENAKSQESSRQE